MIQTAPESVADEYERLRQEDHHSHNTKTTAADRILSALLNPTEAMIKAAEKAECAGHPAFRYERIIKAMCASLEPTRIDRSLALAKARQDAYARDPEKYEELENDAKLYPEGDSNAECTDSTDSTENADK